MEEDRRTPEEATDVEDKLRKAFGKPP